MPEVHVQPGIAAVTNQSVITQLSQVPFERLERLCD